MISDWRENIPGWLRTAPAVVIRRGSSVEKEVPIGSLGLVDHLSYFLQACL